jgi:translation initiation factor IF-1
MTKESKIVKDGYVIENINGSNFKVKLCDSDHIIDAHISGKMLHNTINVLEGDKVSVEISKYDTNKGIIKFRYRNPQ